MGVPGGEVWGLPFPMGGNPWGLPFPTGGNPPLGASLVKPQKIHILTLRIARDARYHTR